MYFANPTYITITVIALTASYKHSLEYATHHLSHITYKYGYFNGFHVTYFKIQV